MAAFRIAECAEPSVWCGNGNMPANIRNNKKYTRNGTRHECMQKGYGSGMHIERKKLLPSNSLQQIKYIGNIYEQKLKNAGLNDSLSLQKYVKKLGKSKTEAFLKIIFTKSDGTIDKRAYNSTLVWLYQHGLGTLPSCMREW